MNKQKLEEISDQLKEAFQQNPVLFMTAVAAVFSGAARLVNAYTGHRNASVWKDEVRRREAKQRERRNREYLGKYDH